MSTILSHRVGTIQPSLTLAITARAAELRAAGKDVIGLGAGEPDFDTPEHVKAMAIQAIHDGKTKYTPVDGTLSLKQAIVDKFQRDNDLTYAMDQILVSCGGKQSFYNLAQAVLNPGDGVIIPAPYWVSYPDMVLLAGGVPTYIHTDANQSFKITPAQLEAAISDATRLMVLNSPSNPSGMAYTEQELKALSDVLLEHPQILIATDDMYEHVIWKNTSFCNLLNVCPELEKRTLVLNGVSKAYSMTGWRIGYAAGPAPIIKAMKTIQSQSTSNPASISQAAAEAALNGPQDCIGKMVAEFEHRHDTVVKRLKQIPGVNCLATDGTFYVFPSVQEMIEHIDGVHNDLDLGEYLIENAGVAVVPGSAFGQPNHIRISIATSMEELNEALDRITQITNG